MRLISFIPIILLASCSLNHKKASLLPPVDYQEVSQIIVSDSNGGDFNLEYDDWKEFISILNQSRKKGMYKMVAEYSFRVVFKDGRERAFHLTRDILQENPVGYSIDGKKLAEILKQSNRYIETKPESLFRVYGITNSCCRICLPNGDILSTSEFITNGPEKTYGSKNAEWNNAKIYYEFKALHKGIDTIYVGIIPPSGDCNSTMKFDNYYVVTVE